MSIIPRAHARPWLPLALALAACSTSSAGHATLASGARPPAYEAASSAPPAAVVEPVAPERDDRPGLGTTWGEAVAAPIHYAPFERAPGAPWAELAIHYNDAAGVAAHARYLGEAPAPLELYAEGGAVSVALVDDGGATLPGLTAGGRTFVIGEAGARYRIVVHNATPARFEIVASVDGLDVIDGHPADPGRRGYLLEPHASLAIDGFRTSEAAVAAFRFGAVADSYAAQAGQPGGDRNVGVIGVAMFAERGARWTPRELARRDAADPFPARGYAAPPR
jgi:hypothetical protein